MYKVVMDGCMQTLCLKLYLPVKVVVEFQFEAVLGLPAAGRENPTHGVLEREEEPCYMDWCYLPRSCKRRIHRKSLS